MKPYTSSCGTSSLLVLLFRQRPESCDSRALLREAVARELNAFLWIALIALTTLFLAKLLDLLLLWAKARPIPGPPCPSFFGHSNLLSRQNFTEVLSDLHKTYGSVVKLWLGPTQLLVSVKDPTLIEELLLKAPDKLPLTGNVFTSFDTVQKSRETLLTELSGNFRERENVILTKAVDCVLERVHRLMGKDSIDSKVVSQNMAFTILGATVFGDAFLAWSKAAVYEELLMMVAKDSCLWASYFISPIWKRGFWRYQSLCTQLKWLTQDIVHEGRKICKPFGLVDHCLNDETENLGKQGLSGRPSCCKVVMVDDKLFEGLNDCHFSVMVDDKLSKELCGNLMGIMFNGSLSTASLINNIMMNLATHPEIQDKIYSEITMVRQGFMKEDQINVDKMLLLLATIYESARLVSAGSFIQRCFLKCDFKLKSGHTIPAGAGLVVPVQLAMMDDSAWGGDAIEFNPSRFLSNAGEGSYILLRQSASGDAKKLANLGESNVSLNDLCKSTALLSFGSERRACVCQRYLIEGVALLFVSLLEHYEIKLQADAPVTPKPNNFVFQILSGSQIAFVQRNS